MSPSRREKLAPGDYVFLCFLLDRPLSAWDVKRLMERTVSAFWVTATSQIYQQASRLGRDGYLREEPLANHPRRRKLLALTPKGRKAVKEWLRAPAASPVYHAEALVKMFFADAAGDPAKTLALMEEQHQRNHERLQQLEADYEVMRTRPDLLYQTIVLEVGIATHRAIQRWSTRAQERIRRERLRTDRNIS